MTAQYLKEIELLKPGTLLLHRETGALFVKMAPNQVTGDVGLFRSDDGVIWHPFDLFPPGAGSLLELFTIIGTP